MSFPPVLKPLSQPSLFYFLIYPGRKTDIFLFFMKDDVWRVLVGLLQGKQAVILKVKQVQILRNE